jgi:hypothetical protein
VSERQRQRNRQLRRRVFHIAIALILILCVMAPYLESTFDLNDSIFATGYDNESTIAVLVLLLELVISLAGLLVAACRNLEFCERIEIKHPSVPVASDFGIRIPELSPPPPLRI